MRADLTENGTLVVTGETALERYALKCWRDCKGALQVGEPGQPAADLATPPPPPPPPPRKPRGMPSIDTTNLGDEEHW